MSTKYHATRLIEIILDGKSMELEANLEFTIAPYVPAQGPSYASGGQPAEGGHVEDVWCQGVKDCGTPVNCPDWFSDFIIENVGRDELYADAMGYEQYLRDEDADCKRRERRDEPQLYAADDLDF